MMTQANITPSAVAAPATTTQSGLLTAALAYAARGWAVLPLHTPGAEGECSCGKMDCRGKHPRTRNGLKDATHDPAVIRQWWAHWPDANIGLACGKASGGALAIDFDSADLYPQWRAAVGALADALVIQKTGKGFHAVLRCEDSGPNTVLACLSDGKTAIETRGEGGYIMAAPSLHPNGKRYEIESGKLTAVPRVKPDDVDRLILAAKRLSKKAEAPDAPPLEVLTAYDALQPQPPIDWICENVLEAASVTVLVGDGGTGKTWAALDLAANVALGRAWMGRAVTGGPVLMVDEESGRRRILRRMGKVLRAVNGNASTPLHCVSLNRFDLRDAPSANQLAGLIIQLQARLVIIDALADIMPGADENAVRDVLPAMQALRQIAELTGAALVVIHHTNKSDGYRGSTAIKGAVENLIKVKKDENRLTFTFEKARDAEVTEFAAVMNFDDDRFYLTPSEAHTGFRLSAAMRYVLAYLSEHGASAMDDIMGGADVCSEESARKAVYQLARQNLIERTDNGGKGGRGQSAVYGLTLAGQNAS